LIGEMMLAKSVLEEKSELLDRKQDLIRQLRSHNKRLEGELEELRGQPSRREGELQRDLERARREGVRDVVEAVVCVAADYEGQEAGIDGSLAARLVRLLQERYALEVLSSAAGGIDPQIHQVVIAEQDPGGSFSVQVLRHGFRLEGKVIKPALVKVVKGIASPASSPSIRPPAVRSETCSAEKVCT
jgi:molecular chaperone GrpE (heat shock protein)